MEKEDLKKKIEEMKVHEVEHCQFFENEIRKRNIKPTKFLPLWDLLGVGLGFGSTLLGKKAAMLCTASVEEVIDKHYLDQINQLGPEEKELKKILLGFDPNLINTQLETISNLKNKLKGNIILNKIEKIDLTNPSEPKIKVFKP